MEKKNTENQKPQKNNFYGNSTPQNKNYKGTGAKSTQKNHRVKHG